MRRRPATTKKRLPARIRVKNTAALARALTSCRHRADTCAVHAVSRAARAIVSLYDRALSDTGVTATQLNVLLTLAQVGPSNVKTLASHVGVDASTMPRVLKRLDERRMVRLAVGADRRHRVVKLTGAGARCVVQALPVWDAVQEQFVSRFGRMAWNRTRHDLTRMFPAARSDILK